MSSLAGACDGNSAAEQLGQLLASGRPRPVPSPALQPMQTWPNSWKMIHVMGRDTDAGVAHVQAYRVGDGSAAARCHLAAW
jgi:hypothetical protein